jgi:hypothetical protein
LEKEKLTVKDKEKEKMSVLKVRDRNEKPTA